MDNNEIRQLIDIRNFLITQYQKKLDGQNNPGTAVILQRDVAAIIEQTVKNIDGVLEKYVSIEGKSE